MRDGDKLVSIAELVAAATDCDDQQEKLLVVCGAMVAAGWLMHPRNRNKVEVFGDMVEGLNAERNGNLPERVVDLSAAGFNGLLFMADFLAPDVEEEL